MQVLSRVLSFAVQQGKLATNPCEGMKRLYSGDRSEIIWTDEHISHFKDFCSPEVAWAVDLAAHTGLRYGDLVRLAWSHVHENDQMIVIPTGKSRGKKEAVIPLYGALRDVLATIPRRSTIILTSTKGLPWDSLACSFGAAKRRAWPDAHRDLHFHDLRGTAATKFYRAGLSERDIAEMMGWEEASVAAIIRKYVNKTAAMKERIKRLDEFKART